MQETERFLTYLFAPYAKSKKARVELRFFPVDKGKPYRAWFPLDPDGIARAAADTLDKRERYSCYMGVLPRVHGGGTAADLRLCGYLWADVDGGEETSDAACMLALGAWMDKGLPEPHLAVVSGGGVHLYWRLAEPVPMSTREDQDALKRILKRIVLLIGGKAPAAHADPAAADAARILRVAGTFNHKKEKPRPVTIWREDPDLRAYPLVWWKAHLPAEPLPPKPRVWQGGRSFSDDMPLPRATVEKLVTPAPDGRRHYTMLEVAVAARKRGLEEEAIRNFAAQVAANSGIDIGDPAQQRHLEGMVDWTVRNVQPEIYPAQGSF